MIDGFVRQQKLYGVDDDDMSHGFEHAASVVRTNLSVRMRRIKTAIGIKNELNNIRRWNY